LFLTSVRDYNMTGFYMALFGAAGLGGFLQENSSETKEGETTLLSHIVKRATDVAIIPILQHLCERERRLLKSREKERDPIITFPHNLSNPHASVTQAPKHDALFDLMCAFKANEDKITVG
jgi:hypothetical protein